MITFAFWVNVGKIGTYMISFEYGTSYNIPY